MNHNVPELNGYFADWCPHCSHAKPLFKEFSTMLKQKFKNNKIDININIYKDGKDSETIVNRNIKGYPTTEFRFPINKNNVIVIPFDIRNIPKEKIRFYIDDIADIFKRNNS